MSYNITRGSVGGKDYFHPLKLAKCQKGFLREKVSTNFVTDCSSGQSSPLFSQGLNILRFNAAVSLER